MKTSKIVASVGGLLVLSLALAYFMVPGLQTRIGGGGGGCRTPRDMRVTAQVLQRKDLPSPNTSTASMTFLDTKSQPVKCAGTARLKKDSQTYTFRSITQSNGGFAYELNMTDGFSITPGMYQYEMDFGSDGSKEITGDIGMAQVSNVQLSNYDASQGTMSLTWDDAQSSTNTEYYFMLQYPPNNSHCRVTNAETMVISGTAQPCWFFSAPQYEQWLTTTTTGTMNVSGVQIDTSRSKANSISYPEVRSILVPPTQ